MNVVDFKTSGYFSWQIIFLGIILSLAGILILTTNIPVGIIMLLISIVIFTTHYRLRIDFSNKVYHDYLWILGMKHGDKQRFENIEYLFIKQSKVSQTMNLKAASTTIRKDVYDGYLKFSDSNKIHLLTMDDKARLISNLNEIAEKLNVKVIDYSKGSVKEI